MPEPSHPDFTQKMGTASWSASTVETAIRVPRAGTLVGGRYEIREKIDPETCLANDTKSDRVVALRSAVWRNPDLAGVWRREVDQLAGVRSAHLLNIFDLFSQGEIDYVASECPCGVSLRDLLRGRPAPELSEVLRLLTPVADALDTAASFVHFWSSPSSRGLYCQVTDPQTNESLARPISEWPPFTVKLDLWSLLRPNHMPSIPPPAIASSEQKSTQAAQQLALLAYELLGGRRRPDGERRRRYRPIGGLNDAANSIIYSGLQGWPLFESAAGFLKDFELASQPGERTALNGAARAVPEPDFFLTEDRRPGSLLRGLWPWLAGIVVALLVGAGFLLLPLRREVAPIKVPIASKQASILSLRSEPAGAVVNLDGTEIGKTPVVTHALSPGSHLLTVEFPGFLSRQIQLDLAAGQTEDLGTVVLQRPSGELSVDTDPAGTPFEVIGPREQHITGLTPVTLRELEPGSYAVHLRPNGQPEYSENVEVDGAQPVRFSHDFPSVASPIPSLALSSSTPVPAATPGPEGKETAERPKELNHGRPHPAHHAAPLSRETAFRQFNAEWDAKEQALDRRIAALDQKLVSAAGLQKKQIATYKKYLQHRKKTVQDLRKYRELSLKHKYNEPDSRSVLDGIKGIFGF